MSTVEDTEGHTIHVGDMVTVVVGPKRTIRPGIVDKITPKNVIVVFAWGNGRVTRRSFPRGFDAVGFPKGPRMIERVADVFAPGFYEWPYTLDELRELFALDGAVRPRAGGVGGAS